MTVTKKKAFRLAIVCGLALALIFAFAGTGTQTHKQRIEAQFSAVNGEHTNLTKAIKATLQDPGEYKTIEASYSDLGQEIFVSQVYTLNGVRHVAKAKVDTMGNILKIMEQQ